MPTHGRFTKERKMMKNNTAVVEYVHESKSASKARLNTVSAMSYEILKKNLVQKKDVLIDGKPVEGTRAMTPTSAELYLFDFVNYACTHHRETIKPSEDDPIYSVIPNVPWGVFCAIVLAGTTGQKDIMQQEITRFAANTPGRVINLKDRPVKTALFFVSIHAKKGKLKARELQRLGALNAYPIETVDIRFVRDLFESVLDKKNNYSNLPTGWHSKIRKHITNAKAETGIEGSDIEIYAGTYEKIWAYLNSHDNGKGNEKMINVWDMLLNTTGMTYIRISKDRFYLREEPGHNGYFFLANVIRTLQDVSHEYRKSLNFEITGFGISPDLFDLDKAERAKKTHPPELIAKAVIDTMIKNYGGYIKIMVIRNPKLAQPELPFTDNKAPKPARPP